MKTLSFIVLFFALLGLSACGNRILVGEHIPKSIVTKTDFDNIKKNNVYNMKSLDDGTSGCDRMPRRTIRELKLTDRYYIRISGFYGPRPLFAYGPTTFTNIIDSYTCEQSADIKALDISNDRKYLAICVQNKGEERGVDILSIKDDLKIIDSKHIPCTDVKISPNNKWLSVQTEKYIYIYDLEKTGNLTFQSKYDGKISYDDSFIKLSPKEFIFLGDYLRTLVVSDSVKSEDKADDKAKILVGKDMPIKILRLKENPDKQIVSFIKHTDCKRPRNSIFNLSGFSLDKYCIEPIFKGMILNLENFKKYIIKDSGFVYNDNYIFACVYADDDKISKVEIFSS